MINIYDPVSAVKAILQSDNDINKAGTKVEVCEYVNMDPDNTPYIGIYPGKVNYDPRTLGRSSVSWSGDLILRFVIQESHLDSGEECYKKLEVLIENLFDALWSDPQLKTYVDMMTALDIEYSYKETESETLHYQWAIITTTWKLSTG